MMPEIISKLVITLRMSVIISKFPKKKLYPKKKRELQLILKLK